MSVRLIDLDPHWIDLGERRGLGILYRCMVGHCNGYNAPLFANPLDGGPPFAGDSWALLDELLQTDLIGYGPDGLRRLVRGCGDCRWTRKGETFEALSMTPSVNAHECGHLTLTDGVFR